MKPRGYFVCFFYDQVRVYRIESAASAEFLCTHMVDVSDQVSLQQTAQAVVNQLLALGYGGQPVVAGLDAFQVLIASVPNDNSNAHSERRKLKLEVLLEEFCPIDAENMCAVQTSAGSKYVWIAIRDRIEPFVKAMCDSDVNVQFVVPTSVLIAKTLLAGKELPDSSKLSILANRYRDTISLVDGEIEGWEFIKLECHGQNDAGPPSFRIAIENNEPRDASCPESTDLPSSIETVLARGFHQLQQNQLENEVPDFGPLCPGSRRPPLRSSLELAGFALIALLLACAASFFLSGRQFLASAKSLDSKSRLLYQRAMPEVPNTRLYERTMQSKLGQLDDQARAFAGTKRTSRVADNLKLVLEQTPPDFGIEFKKIRIGSTRIELNGQVAELEVLDQFKKSLTDQGLTHVASQHVYGKEFMLVYTVPESQSTIGP